MTVFKNRRGFTLIDVMIAIAIVALVLTPIFAFQFQVVRRVNALFIRYCRLLLAENMLVEMHEQRIVSNEIAKQQKKEATPPTILSYEVMPVQHPVLKKSSHLYIERITISDPAGNVKDDILGTIVFKPMQANEQKK